MGKVASYQQEPGAIPVLFGTSCRTFGEFYLSSAELRRARVVIADQVKPVTSAKKHTFFAITSIPITREYSRLASPAPNSVVGDDLVVRPYPLGNAAQGLVVGIGRLNACKIIRVKRRRVVPI